MSSDYYWKIDAPGLDADGAARLVETADAMPQVIGASAVDPHAWFTPGSRVGARAATREPRDNDAPAPNGAGAHAGCG